MTKRALSLDDLVNHDEGDKSKLQKLSEAADSQMNQDNSPEAPVRKTSIGIADINNSEEIDNNNRPVPVPKDRNILNEEPTNHTQLNNENAGRSPNTPKNVSEDNGDENTGTLNADVSITNDDDDDNNDNDDDDDEDETDTDDELGGSGEINFDSGMTFDYDKQDRNSPQRNEATSKAKKATIILPNKEEDPILPKPEKPKEPEVPKESEPPKESKITKDLKEAETATETVKPATVKLETTELKPIVRKIEPKKSIDKSSTSNSVSNIFEEKISAESKRNNIKKDLQVLNEISASSKPNKYKNVPIWAQKWRPTVSALQNIDVKDFKVDPSFLNMIPDDDLTKSVQDWVYATVHSIAPDMRQFIELEMKFGVIVDSKTPDRVTPPISSQAVYTDQDAHLTPNVDEVLFKELNKYVRGISELTENSGKFNIIESQTKDSVYRVGLSTQRPRFLRMSTDVKTGRVGQFIEKRHIAQILMFSPKDSYDMKISLNLELPVPENDPPEKYQSQTPVSERTKDRVSYIHNDSCTRIDITKVQNHNQGVKGRHTEVTHEIELEINTPALLNAFENINVDSKEYATVIRTFLNNGTIIRRKLTTLSYEIFEGK